MSVHSFSEPFSTIHSNGGEIKLFEKKGETILSIL